MAKVKVVPPHKTLLPADDVNVAKKLGENLELFRKKRGLSRKELARKSSVSESAYASYAAGNRLPSIEKIMVFSAVLSCTVADLLGTEKANGIQEFDWRFHRCIGIANRAGYEVKWSKNTDFVTLKPSSDCKTPIIMSEVVFIGVFEQVVEIALESVNLAKIADDYIHKTIINDDDSDDEHSE